MNLSCLGAASPASKNTHSKKGARALAPAAQGAAAAAATAGAAASLRRPCSPPPAPCAGCRARCSWTTPGARVPGFRVHEEEPHSGTLGVLAVAPLKSKR